MATKIFDKTKSNIREAFGFTEDQLNWSMKQFCNGNVGDVIETIITSEMPKGMKYLLMINLGIHINSVAMQETMKTLAREKLISNDIQSDTGEPSSELPEVQQAQEQGTQPETEATVLG